MGIAAVIGDTVAAISSAFSGAAAGIGGLAAGAGIAGTATSGLAGAIGTGVVGGLTGAGLGAAEAAATGGNPLKGAEFGGITGGAVGGLGNAIGAATGLSATAGDVIAGAGGGALGAAATGQPIGTGLLEGAGSGLVSGLISGGGGIGGTTTAPGVSSVGADATGAAAGLNAPSISTPGPSAASISAPAGAGVGDLTASAPGIGSAPPVGTELAGVDANSLASQLQLSTSGGGPTQLDTAISSPQAAASGIGAQSSATDAGLPTPPIPPALDASGSPIASTASGPSSGWSVTAEGGANVSPITTASPISNFFATTPSAAAIQAAPVGGADSININTTGTPLIPAASTASAIGAAPDNSIIGQLGSIVSGPTGKTLGVGIAGLGLAKDLLAPSTPKYGNVLQAQAATANQQSGILQNYLNTGTLPPAVQASVNAATQAGIARIRSQNAAAGIAPGSEQEVSAINTLQQQAVYQGAQLADQLYSQGITQAELSGRLYQTLMNTNQQQNQQTGTAIGNLASALAGGGRVIQVGG